MEDEHFFGSYEGGPVHAEESLAPEFDSVEAQPPSAEQVAHFTRFRKPVAWIMAAMGSLSLVALGQHVFQQNSRRDLVAHVGSTTAIRTAAAAKSFASASAMPGRSVLVSAVERPSEAPGSWTELAESALAFVLEPARPSTSGSKLHSLAAAPAMQANLVNDFTSELLSICRDARS
jgi:hypothetical protein